MAGGPLDGIRVIDLTSIVLGPMATQNLGDLGADVIKVEAPEGDSTRYTGPARSPDMAALFMGVNRNKRSIVLDLKEPAAKEALWRLIEGADIFVHSIRPKKLAALGFSDAAVCARNPKIIYAGLHGYGSGGPYAGRPAYDDVIQALSGGADLMAKVVGEPRYMPSIIADKTSALTATYAIIAALFARERSGRGQVVEVPMFETMVAFNLTEHLYGHQFSPPKGPMGYPRVLSASRRPYPTQDGHICMLAYTDSHWQKFWACVKQPERLADPRFKTLSDRTRNVDVLYSLAGECLQHQTTEHWLERFESIDIPAAPVMTLEQLERDPHLRAVKFFRTAHHATEGDIVLMDAPIRFSDSKIENDRLQPRLGEHTREVLTAAGLSSGEIATIVGSSIQFSA